MKYFTLFLSLFLSGTLWSQNTGKIWDTYYEKSGFTETPRYDRTIKFCKQMADASPLVYFTDFGKSAQGRDLPLLIVDRNGSFDPQLIRNSGNAVVLIQACIHAGEPDGKDAGMMLIRDIIFNKKYEDLIDHVTILFIPILNVDGHERFGPLNRINQNGPREMGWRTNAQNLNLNRDYLKAESPEIQNWLELYKAWQPDFFIDCHVSDGADYQYALTYSMDIYGSMDPDITMWLKGKYISEVEKRMKVSGFPIIPYVDFRKWHDPRSGLETWASPPMFSQGYVACQNRPSLLIETHMLKDYKTRVTATYEILRHTLDIVNDEYKDLTKINKKVDKYVASKEFRAKDFPVQYETSQTDSTMIDFLGVEYTVEKSDLTGGDWFKYSKIPKTYNIPYFSKVEPKVSVKLPEAYVIPPEYKFIQEKLRFHGIQYQVIFKDQQAKVSSYKFTNVKFRPAPYEGHQTVETDYAIIEEERTIPAGSLLVKTDQSSVKIIAHLLEPMAPSSLLWWGYFNTVFEQKEYTESYVMEEMARKMLQENPQLKKDLDARRAADPKFGKSPFEILNWFYSQTPYWDNRKDIYPIGKIFDPKELNNLTGVH